ncbi:MAG: AccI family restriction endonuclease [Aridibacter sp.]
MAQTPRFRGDDFKGKWSLGSWAEQKIIDAINASELLCAVPYGKSEVSSAKSKEEIQDYWKLHKERESFGKRPDLLVFEKDIFEQITKDSEKAILLNDLPNNLEADIEEILNQSVLGVESEASIWQGEKMPHFGRS